MITRTTRAQLSTLAITLTGALPLLAACSSPAENTTTSGNSEAPAAAINATVTPSDNLAEGDILTVGLSGLDPDLGYYAGICARENRANNPVPDCTGDRTLQGTQAWIINRDGGTATISPEGSATFDLTVATKGEAVNCLEQDCVVKIFGDHTEGFNRILDVPVTFAN